MGYSRKPLLATGGTDMRTRASDAMRSSVEAVLLMAVALGCAQAGWSLIAPSQAGARAADDPDLSPAAATEITDTAFAPGQANGGGDGYVATLLAGIQLKGVRTGAGDTVGGAILALSDGEQRAFSVGQEVTTGVLLQDVGADYVLLTYQGGSQRLAMPAAPNYSFARALMGLDPAAAPSEAPALAAPFATVAAPAIVAPTPDTMSWLAQALSQVQDDGAGGVGWRIVDPTPEAARVAGLKAGDLVLAVDGATPGQGLGFLAEAMADGIAALTVKRADGSMTVVTVRLGAPA